MIKSCVRVGLLTLSLNLALAGGFSPQEVEFMHRGFPLHERVISSNSIKNKNFNYENKNSYSTKYGDVITYGNGKKNDSDKFSIEFFSHLKKSTLWKFSSDGSITSVHNIGSFMGFTTILDSASIQEESYILDTSKGLFIDVPDGYIIRSSYLDKAVAEYNPPTSVLDSEPAYFNAKRVYLGIFDFRKRTFYKRHVDIPSRSGCGKMNFAENYRGDRVWNGAYLTVKRKDTCGTFSYTFNWYN